MMPYSVSVMADTQPLQGRRILVTGGATGIGAAAVGVLTEAVRAGHLAPQPMRPLAHILIGALDEAAMVIATADDPKRARRETGEVLHRLIDAMLDER